MRDLAARVLAKLSPSPAGADPRMARWRNLMPLVSGSALYRRPAALMAWWLTGNLLQLARRWWLSKRYA